MNRGLRLHGPKARFVKVYNFHKLCRNVRSHNSCGNARGISTSFKDCGNVEGNFSLKYYNVKMSVLFSWMVPSIIQFFYLLMAQNSFSCFGVSFYFFSFKVKVLDIFHTFSNGGGMLVTWSLPGFNWSLLKIYLLWRRSSIVIKQTEGDVPCYSHYCFFQTPGLG